MTPKEYARALELIGLTNYEFCNLIGLPDRTGRNWWIGRHPIPPTTQALLRLAARTRITPSRLAKLIANPL